MQQRQRVNQSEALSLNIAEIFKEDEFLQKPLQSTPIVQGEVWEITNFFTQKTCKRLIDLTEQQGFTVAPLTTGIGTGVIDTSVRDCTRVMIDDFEAAVFLYEVLRPVVPLCYEGALYDGVNERFRFLKYTPGQKFKPHCDGRYPQSDYCVSMVTLHLYLNTVEEGGETSFFLEPNNQYGLNTNRIDFKSIEGRAALFRQNGWLHSGNVVKAGVKYTIRNELMYRWLDNEELQDRDYELRKLKCGLCKGGITKFSMSNSCPHKLCKCPVFYNQKKKDRCSLC